MKKVAAGLVVVAFANSYALGGIVTFNQTSTNVVYNDSALGDTTATFEVTVSATDFADGRFNSIDVIIGSNDLAVGVADWAYDDDFRAAVGFFIGTPAFQGVYTSDVKVGGFAGGGLTPPTPIGTVTIDADGLDPGDYTVSVDSSFDGFLTKLQNSDFTGVQEGLLGSAMVNVVPEPATLSLLGLAALALVRRRKTA